MIVIFVEFIDQLIDYPINRASPTIQGRYCIFHLSYLPVRSDYFPCPRYKTVGNVQTAVAQISLCISAVWSGPSLFAKNVTWY